MTKNYDVIIVGGGLVGSSLLLAIKQSGLKVCLIEAKEHISRMTPALDQRSLVLSLASKLFYEQLGVWSELVKYTTPINKITISEQGRFSKLFLDKTSLGVTALGYVVNIPLLNQTIWNAINLDLNDNNIEIFCPAKLYTLEQNQDAVIISLEQNNEIQTIAGKMLIAADGGRSYIRDILQISNKAYNYEQTALIANVRHELINHNIAYERFSKQGPFALLPGSDPNISGIVWPWPTEEIEYIKSLSDQELLQKLQKLFGYKLGHFLSIGERQWFPLWRIVSQELTKDRVLLLGNAANNIHPVGGQGFNLGLRDVKHFSSILLNKQSKFITTTDLTLEQINFIFDEYKKSRINDHYNLNNGTHGLLKLFETQNPIIKVMRNIGMTMTNHSLILRSFIADYSMGLSS